MLDDTREILSDSQASIRAWPQFRLSENVADILDNPMMRHHARRWASNLRFLTFDDSCGDDFESNSTTLTTARNQKSPLRGQCQPCARRVPIPSGHMCESHVMNRSNVSDREAELHRYADPCVHIRERSCDDCRHIPLFPNELKSTRFRIRRVYPSDDEETAQCTDFVAVSYCWSNEKNDDKTTPYKVIEEDGRIRDARASNATIDRIVAFARENGFRMIWIDQECIEQDNPEEKELAIQAMDYVYLKAHTSIALFHAELQQKHLECVLLAYESQIAQAKKRRGRRALHGCRAVSLVAMCEAVSMIVNDRWNTRAWILQEAFSSSGNMVLLFPRIKGVNVRSWMLVCHERSQSEIAVRLDTLQNCLRICSQMILPTLRATLQAKENEGRNQQAREGQSSKERPRRRQQMKQTRRGNDDQEFLGNADEIRTTIKRLQIFHPEEPEHPCKIIFGSTKPRRTCNAAVALTYLQLRNMERVADKLAIIANICGYDLRLDTTKLEKTQNSLSACILTLALANGDFSLLIPQVYRTPPTTTLEFPSCEDVEFTWLHSLAQNLQCAESTSWNPSGPTTGGDDSTPIRLSEKGLSLPGNLWNVNRFLDLRTLQVKYGDSWLRLRNAKGTSRPSPRTINLATTHLLFEIIKLLVSMDEKRVANSIFNSTSYWRWNSRDTVMQSDMIESVDQFPSGLQIENRKGMFALDSSPDGWYHQCWIIDRVMEKGGFWVGSIMKEVREEPGNPTVTESTSDGDERLAGDQHDQNTNTENPESAEPDLSLEQTSNTDAEPIPNPTWLEHGHSGLMLIASLMTGMGQRKIDFSTTELEEMRVRGENPATLYLSAQSFSLFALANAKLTYGKDDTNQRQAIFDIDGCSEGRAIVLTPFQMTLESIPRPAMRGMSVSWVVEKIDGVGEDGSQTPTERIERFKVKGMTRGMWAFAVFPSGRYEIA